MTERKTESGHQRKLEQCGRIKWSVQRYQNQQTGAKILLLVLSLPATRPFQVRYLCDFRCANDWVKYFNLNCKCCFNAGASKIVPIEAAPAEPSTPTDAPAGSQEEALKRGYQEYAIQQAAFEVPLKSNRFCSCIIFKL